MKLMRAGADGIVRETFESAIDLGGQALAVLGEDPETVAEVIEGVRTRDEARIALQFAGGITAGRDLLLSNAQTLRPRDAGLAPPDQGHDQRALNQPA
jgi:glutathione-regulated potassium-efflux system protein KefB